MPARRGSTRPRARVVATVETGLRPVNLDAVGARRLGADDEGDQVFRISPATNSVTETIPVGDGPAVVAPAEGDVWVTNFEGGSVWRIRPSG